MSETTILTELAARLPVVEQGWWTTVGGSNALVDGSDSSYLRAFQASWQQSWHWSTPVGSGGMLQWKPNIPDEFDDPDLEVTRVRFCARARFEENTNPKDGQPEYGYLFWQASLSEQIKWKVRRSRSRHHWRRARRKHSKHRRHPHKTPHPGGPHPHHHHRPKFKIKTKIITHTWGGLPDKVRIDGNTFQDVKTPWLTCDPAGDPWTLETLDSLLISTGRTMTWGRMRLSRVWVEFEVPGVPDLTMTGPTGLVEDTSQPEVSWRPEGDFVQSGWEVEVYRGFHAARPLNQEPVTASGEQQDTDNRWVTNEPLEPAGPYTAFGRVARFWGGRLIWSRWRYTQWTMAIPEPPPQIPPQVDPNLEDLSLTVTWPTLTEAGFGLGPFGLTAFGGIPLHIIDIESSDDLDGPWTYRESLDATELTSWDDPLAPFGQPRWYRLRGGREEGTGYLYSDPSDPVSGTLTPPAGTAAITDLDTFETVVVSLRGLPLTPTYRSRMMVMAAADMDVATAQGQVPVTEYSGSLWAVAADYPTVARLVQTTTIKLWRDDYRYRFAFVWDGDTGMQPVLGKSNTPHLSSVTMAEVAFPERMH